MTILAPHLAPRLDRELAALAQGLPVDDRMELLAALDHIARSLGDDPKPVSRLTDPRIPRKARQAICAVTPFGTDASWLATHQKRWAEPEKYEAVIKAATATAIYAARSPALDDLPRYRVELLHNVIWLVTVAPSGKFATRYRSRGAVADPYAALRHEHVYTRRALVEDLLDASPEDVEQILRSRAIGCTLTKAEHDLITPFDNTEKGWTRYAKAGVVVIDMLTGQTLNTAATDETIL